MIIPFIIIVVNFDENGKRNYPLFSELQGLISGAGKEYNPATKKFIDLMNVADSKGLVNGTNIDKLVKHLGDVDKNAIKAAKSIQETGGSIEDFNKAVGGASGGVSKFGLALKSAAINMGAMIAVMAVIKLISVAWDKANVTVQESKDKYNKLAESMQTLNEEYESLSSKDFDKLTSSEKERLSYLKSRIEAEKELLDIQKHNIYREEIGNKFTDQFDKDNQHTKLANAKNYNVGDGKSTGIGSTEGSNIERLIDAYERASASSAKFKKAVSETEKGNYTYLSSFDSILTNSNDYADLTNNLTDAEIKRKQALSDLIVKQDELRADMSTYATEYEHMQEMIKSGLLTETELSDAQNIANQWEEKAIAAQKYLDVLEGIQMTSDISNLGNIYQTIGEKNYFDFSGFDNDTFKSFFQETEEAKNAYEEFVGVINKSPDDIIACTTAFDDLIATWAVGDMEVTNITDGLRQSTIATLENKGVADASTVAEYALAAAKRRTFIESHNAANGITIEVSKLQEEATALGYTEDETYDLIRAVIAFNITQIDVSSDLQQLNALQFALQQVEAAAYGAAHAKTLAELGMSATAGYLMEESSLKSAYRSYTGNLTYAQWKAQWIAKNQNGNKNNDKTPTIKYPPAGTGGGSKGGGSGSGSKSEPYKADINKYKDLEDAIEAVKTEIEHLNQVYDHTDSIEEQIALKDQLIGLYEKEQNALTTLNNARDKEIQENVDKLRKAGFQIDYDPKTDYLHIKNREKLNTLSQDSIKTYEEYIKTADDLNQKNKDSAEEWRKLSYSIQDVVKEISELRHKQYTDAIDDAEHLIELMNKRKDTRGADLNVIITMMNQTLDEWKRLVREGYEANEETIEDLEEAWMKYYDQRLEKEKEILELQKADKDKALSAVLDLIDEQIKGIDDEIKSMKKLNDERKEALDLQKKQADLDKAKSQKTNQVLRKGQGWVYEADEDAVKAAEEALADAKFEKRVNALEKEKEELEEYKNIWQELPDLFEKQQNKLMAEQLIGKNWEKNVLDQRLDVYNKFKDGYIGVQKQIYDITYELDNHMNETYLNMVKRFQEIQQMFAHPTPSTGNTGKSWYVDKDGKAPSQAQVGDTIYTKGGTYRITGKDANGKFTSEKIDSNANTIPEGMWGKEIEKGNSKLTYALGENALSNKDVVDASTQQTEQIKKQLLSTGALDKTLQEGKKVTKEEVEAVLEQCGYVDENSFKLNGNTVAVGDLTTSIYTLVDAINNGVIETENPFEDLNWGSMSGDEKNYVSQLKDAYQTALSQGNTVAANQILKMLQDFKDGNGDAYIQIGKDAYNAATSAFGDVKKSTINSSDRISDLEKQLELSKKSGASKDSIDRLERAIAVEKYGSGTEIYSSGNGYITHNIISSKDEKEMYMTADEIKQKYDYEKGNVNNGYDPEKMAQTIADRIVEAQNDKNSVWGSVFTNDIIGSIVDKVREDDKATLGTLGNKTSTSTKSEGQKKAETLNQSAQDAIKAAQQAYNDAKAKGDTAGMEKAHAEAEAIRLKNGYSGGVDGSKVIATSNKNVTNALNVNKDAISDNSDTVSDASKTVADASKDASKAISQAADKIADSTKSTVNISGGSGSSGGSSGGSKSSGGSGSSSSSKTLSGVVSSNTVDNGAVKVTTATRTDGSTVQTVVDKSSGRVIGSVTTPPKKAKGGLKLPAGTYNVDELGDELIINPKEGRYTELQTGASVIPADVSKRLWEFGANPKEYLDNIGGIRNVASVLSVKAGNGGNIINLDRMELILPNVSNADDFMKVLPSLPSKAVQFATKR